MFSILILPFPFKKAFKGLLFIPKWLASSTCVIPLFFRASSIASLNINIEYKDCLLYTSPSPRDCS